MSHISNLNAKKILIRLPNWLGDVVMSTAFVSAARQLYPAAQIDIIIKENLLGIAALIPGITIIHSFSKSKSNGLPGVYRYGKLLRREQYDLFFNLPSSLSSAVLGWATNAKIRVGFKNEGGVFLYTKAYNRPLNLHRVDEYISLLAQYTGKIIAQKNVSLRLDVAGPRNASLVLINFNSEASSRRMPLAKAIALTNSLSAALPGSTFAFVGAPAEAGFVEQIIDGIEDKTKIENHAGKTDIAGLCRLMASAAVMLTTDSGPAHLANSVGTPTVVLFGAGDENNTAPYNKQNLIVIRDSQLPCEPCLKNTCKLYGIPKCMELLNELQIIASLSLYLPHA